MLAEEHVWRYLHAHAPARRRRSWYPAECQPRDPDEAQKILEAEASVGQARGRAQEIATVYRALRKGREDGKDEPGAADFYYGEMEMRRKAAGGSVEGMLLTAYWLLSGYGLRAWRALAALVVVLTLATTLFATGGIAVTRDTIFIPGPERGAYVSAKSDAHPPTWDDAFYYTWQYATSLVRPIPDPPELTSMGRVLEISLRLAGPGLLALVVLAVRARVKR